MDKNAILKARVTDAVHSDFLAICAAMGRSPAAMLRELVEAHVASHSLMLEDDVRIMMERPTNYQDGAWRCRMTLRSPAAMEFGGAPVPFRFPNLPHRRIHPDKGFRVAAVDWDGKGSGLDGIFVDGIWEGHVYTNGIGEADNPTTIEDVIAALKATVRDRIVAFRGSAE